MVRWHAAEGERVAQGQVLLEVETDKVTVEVEAPASGVMGPVLSRRRLESAGGTLRAFLRGLLRMTSARRSNRGIRSTISGPADGRAGRRRWAVAPGRPEVSTEDVQVALRKNLSVKHGAGIDLRWRARLFVAARSEDRRGRLGLDWRELPGSGPRGRVIETGRARA